LRGQGVDTRDLSQVYTKCPVESLAQLRWFISPGGFTRATFASLRRLISLGNFRRKPLHHLLHLCIDFLDQLLGIPVGFEGLAERKQVLFTVVADERFHDGLFTGANARVTQSSQLERIAFSGQDRADFIAGAKRPAQQPHGMKVLNPLAVGNIGLSAGHVLDVMGIDQPYVDLALLQNLEQWNSIDAG